MRHKILIVAINHFTLRMFSETPLLKHLAANPDLDIAFIVPNLHYDSHLDDAEVKANIHWHLLTKPQDDLSSFRYGGWHRGAAFLHRQINRTLLNQRAEFANLFYRFSEIHQFVRFVQRKALPKDERDYQASRYIFLEPEYGVPLPKSKRLFQFLYRFHYFPYQQPDMYVEAFFETYQPHLVVLAHVQNKFIKPYWVAAKRRGIPMVGIVTSWDQPTLSGPLAPDLDDYIVVNKMMVDHLVNYHGLPRQKIHPVGWPQHDFYHQPNTTIDRDQFLTQTIGIPSHHRYILWASYPADWVAYEPSILAYLIDQINERAYGDDFSLIIRPHPLDKTAERLKAHENPPYVIVETPEIGNLKHLYNLLKYAAMVIAPASTITLDAAALDTPVININFDGDATPNYYKSSQRWYEAEHYGEVVKTGGISLVDSFASLDDAIQAYLDDPTYHANERAALRDYLVNPCDGYAHQRIAKLITDML